MTYESIMGDTEDESIFIIYYKKWLGTKQPATHKVEKRTRYLSIYQTFNENMKFQFYSTIFFCRITWWQMVNCIRATFFNYQDIIKDCFLLSKMILSVSGGTILTDYTFAALVSIFGIFLDENFISLLP